jgi:hypothetical protein
MVLSLEKRRMKSQSESHSAGSFEAEDTRQDRKACVEAMRSAIAGHPSDGATKTNSQSALGGRVS